MYKLCIISKLISNLNFVKERCQRKVKFLYFIRFLFTILYTNFTNMARLLVLALLLKLYPIVSK